MVKRAAMRSRSLIAWMVTAGMLTYINFNQSPWKEGYFLSYDIVYYYLFLPATIIHNDLGKLEFYPAMVEQYSISGKQPTYELYPQAKTGRITDKYAVGVAVCELPFFLIAHGYCLMTGAYAADGFSLPYRMSIVFAVMVWVLAGLYVLRKLLLSYYDETTTAVTLLLIAFGTNLYFYTVDHVGMSHPFSFALACMLLYTTDLVYRKGKAKYFILSGLILGLITIVRPTNLLMALFPLCWPVAAGNGRTRFLRTHLPSIAMGCLCFCVVAMLEFGYLKYTSGDWLHFSYEEEGFNFLKPEIWNGLFSYRKGWFVYTPLALFAIAGLAPLWQSRRRLAGLILAYLVLQVYVIFSWGTWAYGGGFGCRPMVESLSILAIPLAAMVSLAISARVWVRVVSCTIAVLLIVLNTFQSYQLALNVTRWDKTTREFYWRSFGKLKLTEEDKKLP